MPDWKEILFGSGEKYNYLAMCKPSVPWKKGGTQKSQFYSKDEPIPIMLAALMGLQHSFSMVGGLITPPLVIFRFAVCFSCVDLQQYAVSAALITSGICSIINVAHTPIPFTEKIFGYQLYLGSGVLSVMGTSFTFLPVFDIAIRQMKSDGIDGEDAYGRMLGTSMLCCLLELAFSVVPVKYLKRVFSPLVTAITVILIGVSLVGAGMKYWGGGVVCADMVWKDTLQALDAREKLAGVDGALINGPPSSLCQNGDVFLGYGSPEFIGLGFSVMVALVVIELFGCIFLKNCNVIVALLFGYFVAAVSNYQGDPYVDSSKIKDADPITFLWVERFPLGFYGPAVIPLLIAYLVTTVETVGDITAVHEVSQLSTETLEYNNSVQGGLTSDAACSILGGFFTSMPNTTFSQNNGVIALTKCASRRAGYACGCWLIFMGIFSKIAGVITSIPDSVLGGMTIFLFANVLVSGITLAGNTLDLHQRRTKFILALSLAVGVGVTVWPFAFQDFRSSPYTAHFWSCSDCSDTMKGVRNGVSIFLSTGYCIGTVMAMLLNAILPEDAGTDYGDDELDDEGNPIKMNDETTKMGVEKPAEDDIVVPDQDEISDEVAA